MTNKEIDIITAHYVSTKLHYIKDVSEDNGNILLSLGRLRALSDLVCDLGLSNECVYRFNYATDNYKGKFKNNE